MSAIHSDWPDLPLSQRPDCLQEPHGGAQLEPQNAREVGLAEQGQRRPLQGVLAENLQETKKNT